MYIHIYIYIYICMFTHIYVRLLGCLSVGGTVGLLRVRYIHMCRAVKVEGM